MSGIEQLVERQMRNWEIGRAQRAERDHKQTNDLGEAADFVAISREVGAGGYEVATMLGERLNWPVFDKEVLHVMAGNDVLRSQVYKSMDERDLGWFEESVRALAQPGFVKNDYFRNLTTTILSLARQAPGVFLGRGADLILPKSVGVRVRLVAAFEDRVQRVARRESLDVERARDMVRRVDAERSEFIQHRFNTSIDAPTRCDLTINQGRYSARESVELIVCALACYNAR